MSICASALGAAAILAGAPLLSWDGPARLRLGRARDRRRVPRLGDRQQSHAQALGRRSAADRDGQGPRRGQRQCRRWRSPAARSGPRPAAVAAAGLIGFMGYGVSLALFVLALGISARRARRPISRSRPSSARALAILGFGEPVTPVFFAAAGADGGRASISISPSGTSTTHAHDALVHEHRHAHDAHHGHAHGAGDPPGEPHTHRTRMRGLVHSHPHFPDIHHRHSH